MTYDVSTLPSLRGSTKQVAWATKIRDQKVPALLGAAASPTESQYAWDLISAVDTAGWWIDYRDHDAAGVIKALIDHVGKHVPRPAADAPAIDPSAAPHHAIDLDKIVSDAKADLQRQPGYHYNAQVLRDRLAAGLAPGDRYANGAGGIITYLGGGQALMQTIGAYGIVLDAKVTAVGQPELDYLLRLIAQSDAKAAVHST